MIHYTCDRCKAEIDPAEQTRYIVQMEVHCVGDGDAEPQDSSEVDSLSELHLLLEGIESEPIESETSTASSDGRCELASDDTLPTHRAQYDLCPACYQSFLRNPLGRDSALQPQFSKN
jgi:hypothetical protein